MTASGSDPARSTIRLAALALERRGRGRPYRVAVTSAVPVDESVEAGFARDMATHHAQAVEMSLLIRDTTSDAALRTLAYDIIVTQSTQRGMFMGWLQAWERRRRPPVHEWHGCPVTDTRRREPENR